MADEALRLNRYEEIHAGIFKYTSTGVEMGSTGIAGLLHYAPVGGNWLFFQEGGHQYEEEWDPPTSRIMTRTTALLGGALSSKLRHRILVPYNFGGFPANALSLIIRMNVVSGPSLTATLLCNGVADSGINGVDIKPAMINTFVMKQLTPVGIYARGDMVTLQIDYSSSGADQYVEIADFCAAYSSGRGNV